MESSLYSVAELEKWFLIIDRFRGWFELAVDSPDLQRTI
jgi:hypothetical protein